MSIYLINIDFMILFCSSFDNKFYESFESELQ